MASSSQPKSGQDMGEVRPPDGRDDGVEEPGGKSAGLRTAAIFGALLVLTTLLVIYGLVQLWPSAPPPPLAGGPTTTIGKPTLTTAGATATTAGATTTISTMIIVQAAPNPPVSIFGSTLRIEREARLFLVVALAGALGGLVYALRSLAWYTGNRNLKYSWLLTYPIQPFVGAALATISYVVIRGGLVVVTTQTSSDAANPFGFAAFGALVGLFSVQATEWLKRVFEQVFAPAPKGKDPAIEPGITDFYPKHGPVGTLVTVIGSGFTDVRTVTFNKVAAADVSRVSDTELRVRVPEGARSGVITISTAAGPSVDSATLFKVDTSGETQPRPAGEESP